MGFGFLILAFILLAVASFAAFGYYGIPVVIVGLIGLGVLFANRAKRVAEGTDTGTPQDTPGGPAHKHEDYAHTGQANMTPEQMKRSGAS